MWKLQIAALMVLALWCYAAVNLLKRDSALLACYVAVAQWLTVAVTLKLAQEVTTVTVFVAMVTYGGILWRAWTWLVRDWDNPQWLRPPEPVWEPPPPPPDRNILKLLQKRNREFLVLVKDALNKMEQEVHFSNVD